MSASLLAGLPSTRRGNFSQLGATQKTRPPAPAVYIPVQDPAAPEPQVIKNDEQTILMRRLYKGRDRLFESPGPSATVTAANDGAVAMPAMTAMTDTAGDTGDADASKAVKRAGDAIGLSASKNPRVSASATGAAPLPMQMELDP